MGIEVKVPALGESITEATLGQWLKQPGDAVAADGFAVAACSALKRVYRERLGAAAGVPLLFVLLDAGANAECQADWLVQFAQMGAAYARARYDVDRPRVGLLSIGEEDTKGTAVTMDLSQEELEQVLSDYEEDLQK